MISAAAIRRRLVAGDTLTVLGAELGITSTSVLGRHRHRPVMTVEECRERSRRRADAEAARRAR